MKSIISSERLNDYSYTIEVVKEHINSFRYDGEKLGMHLKRRRRLYR